MIEGQPVENSKSAIEKDIEPECPFRMPVYTVFTVFLDTPDVNNLFKL